MTNLGWLYLLPKFLIDYFFSPQKISELIMTKFNTNLMKSASAVALLLACNATQAFAADDLQPVRETQHDWNGLYFGAHVGVAGGVNDGAEEFTSSSHVDLGATSDDFLLGGGQIGWNFQNGDTLFGIEGDISVLSWDGEGFEAEAPTNSSSSILFDGSYLATIRGRMGIVDDDVLLYATGGVAFLSGDLDDVGDNDSSSIDAVGAVVGAGLEWAYADNATVKIEGIYARFDERDGLNGFTGNDPQDFFELEDIVVLRMGANWKYDAVSNGVNRYPDEPERDWTGIYFGGLVGAGTLQPEGFYDGNGSTSLINMGGLSDSGLVAGGLIGWNFYQNGHTVLGIEGDISFADWENTSNSGDLTDGSLSLDTNYFATIRGRAGYADGDLLIYATAGAAFLSGDLNFNGVTGVAPSDRGFTSTGIVVGAGMEWAATDNFTVKAEGLYASFNDSYSLAGLNDAQAGDDFNPDNVVVTRISLNWYLN
ncbi:MAG: outer membrane protein [Rhizobiaceae bacterium]